MPARIEIAPELIVEAKYLYEQTHTTIEEIGDRIGLSRSALYVRLKKWKWQRRRYSPGVAADADPSNVAAAAPDETIERPSQADTEDNAATETPDVFYARVCRGVQRQMTIIEHLQRSLLPAGGAMPSERSARVLATINRALLEIEATAKPDKVPDEPDDSIPRDIDEFRTQLARRIRGLVEAERERAGERAGPDSAD
jgi:DNA-binding Lrp family transcriptional regulator